MNLVDWLWSLLVIFFMVMFFMIFFMVIIDLFGDHSLGGGAKALWVIFLIVMPPLAVLIYLVARGNSMAERRQAQMKQAQESQRAYIQQVAATGSAPADQIASAKALLDSGAITQAEYDTLKAKALA
jgi:ABC-type multidrug transport system fused ATPase/permease subunit